MTAPKNKLQPDARSLPPLNDWQAIAVICAGVGVFFRDIIFQNAFFWEDFLYYFYPVRNFAAVSISKGEIPLWNPYTLNGMPFQADIQSGIFYLPNLLLTLFVSGERLNFYWLELEIIAHYVIAGICMYYLAKHFGLPGLIALFSALVYALSGFMIVHAIHQVVICQVAWLPLVVLLFHKALQERSLNATIGGGLLLGHAVLAGYPQMSLYVYFFLFLFFVFEAAVAWKERGSSAAIKVALPAAGFIAIAILVTAIQLLPTIELAPQSQRSEISYEKSQEGVVALSQLVTLVVPKFFGTSGAQENAYWGPGVYWAFWETCLYFGIAALVCTIVCLVIVRKNRYALFLAGVVFFCLLFAIGDQFFLHKLFFYYVPGFSKFRNPGRIAILISLSAALLSGFGLDALIRTGQENFKKIRVTLGIILGAGVLLTIAVFQGFLQPTGNNALYQQIAPLVTSEMKEAMILIVVVLAILYALAARKIPLAAGVAALCLVQFVDMHIFGFNQNNSSQHPGQYYDRPARLVSMLKEEGTSEFTRINTRKGNAMLLDRNQGMVDRVFMMEGYTPLALQRYLPPGKSWDQICDLMNAKYRIHVDEQGRSMDLSTAATYIPRAHFVYDEHVLTSEGDLRSFMEGGGFDPATTLALEEPGGLSLHDTLRHTDAAASISSYSLGSIGIDISAPRDGYLLLSEIYYPGWNAYVDGVQGKVLRADWCLRAVAVKAGSHRVDFRFEPSSFRNGMWLTIGTLALCFGGLVYSRKRTAATA